MRETNYCSASTPRYAYVSKEAYHMATEPHHSSTNISIAMVCLRLTPVCARLRTPARECAFVCPEFGGRAAGRVAHVSAYGHQSVCLCVCVCDSVRRGSSWSGTTLLQVIHSERLYCNLSLPNRRAGYRQCYHKH